MTKKSHRKHHDCHCRAVGPCAVRRHYRINVGGRPIARRCYRGCMTIRHPGEPEQTQRSRKRMLAVAGTVLSILLTVLGYHAAKYGISTALFWVGGTNNWDGTTNRFATSTGGTATVAAPGSADTVTFDNGTGGAGTCTVTAAGGVSVTSFTVSTTSNSLVFNVAGTCSGAMTLTAGTLNTNGQTMNWGSFAGSNSNVRTITLGSSTINLTATTNVTVWTTATVTNLTVTANTANINATGVHSGTHTITSGAKTWGGTLTLSGGANYAMGGTPTWGALVVSSNAVLVTISGAMTISGTTAINSGGTLSVTAAVTFSGGITGTNGSGVTISNLSVAVLGTLSVSGGVLTISTTWDLSIIGTNISCVNRATLLIVAGGVLTVGGTLTVAGSATQGNGSQWASVKSNALGSQAIVSLSASGMVINGDVYFTDISVVKTGGGNPTYTNSGNAWVGDLGGNTFAGSTPVTPATTQTWGGGGNVTGVWSDATKWTSRVPLPQDSAVVPGMTNGTLTLDTSTIGGFDMTASSGGNLFFSAGLNVYGSFLINFNLSKTGATHPSPSFNGRGNFTFNTGLGSESISFNCVTGTYTAVAAIGCANLTVTSGTLDANGFNVSLASYSSAVSGTINMGSGTWTCTGTWSPGLLTVINGQTSTLIFTPPGNAGVFSPIVGNTYYNVTVDTSNTNASMTFNFAASLGVIAISNNLTLNPSLRQPLTLQLANGLTWTVYSLVAMGSATVGNTLQSNNAGTASALSVTGACRCDYLSVKDNTGAGAIPLYAGVHGTLVSNTTNWVLAFAPVFPVITPPDATLTWKKMARFARPRRNTWSDFTQVRVPDRPLAFRPAAYKLARIPRPRRNAWSDHNQVRIPPRPLRSSVSAYRLSRFPRPKRNLWSDPTQVRVPDRPGRKNQTRDYKISFYPRGSGAPQPWPAVPIPSGPAVWYGATTGFARSPAGGGPQSVPEVTQGGTQQERIGGPASPRTGTVQN